jgi:hypothetical protein
LLLKNPKIKEQGPKLLQSSNKKPPTTEKKRQINVSEEDVEPCDTQLSEDNEDDSDMGFQTPTEV